MPPVPSPWDVPGRAVAGVPAEWSMLHLQPRKERAHTPGSNQRADLPAVGWCAQERLSIITARYLEAPLGGQQLEAYVQECGQLLGLRSSRAEAGAKAQLAEVLEAVVQCKMPDACS